MFKLHRTRRGMPNWQRGGASLLLLPLAGLGLIAATAGVTMSVRNAQKLKYTEHTSTQAQMRAWAGVSVVSQSITGVLKQSGVTATNLAASLGAAGTSVGVAGLTGVDARYRGTDASGFLLFDVTGSSAGATNTLRVAVNASASGSGSGSGETLSGPIQLTGNTKITGSTGFTGGASSTASIGVSGGTLSISGSASGFGKICATGDISLNGSASAAAACTNGNISLSGNTFVGTITAVGTISAGSSNVTTKVTSTGPAFTPSSIVVDAYTLRSSANLQFTGVDAQGNAMVTVKNIAGVTDGAYRLAKNASGAPDYLCAAVSGTSCVSPITRVCYGSNPSKSCYGYSNGQWTIDGDAGGAMLPLAVAFSGDLLLKSGTFVGGFIATGDIVVSSNVTVYAPNWIGNSAACQGGAYAGYNGSAAVSPLSSFGMSSAYRATQLCSGTGSSAALTADALGNVALYAGGYSGANQTGFTGGNIDMQANAQVYGSVIAGQYLSTSGNSLINGYIYTGQQGGATSQGNVMSGSTSISTAGSSAYNGLAAPCAKSGGCGAQTAAYNIVWVSPI